MNSSLHGHDLLVAQIKINIDGKAKENPGQAWWYSKLTLWIWLFGLLSALVTASC